MIMRFALASVGMALATPATAATFDFVIGAGSGPSLYGTGNAAGVTLVGNAYDPAFTGGVYVAAGDVTGDGVADIVTGAGAGGGPHVKVFDGITGAETASFFAYDAAFRGGVRVAVGDLDGDARGDVVTGAGTGGGPHVRVFSGATGAEIRSFFAFEASYAGGIRVASGDVNGDGAADIVVGADQGSSAVKVFDGKTGNILASFFGGAPGANGGGLALGRFGGVDALFVGAGAGSAPVINIFSLSDFTLIGSRLAFDPGFLGGVSVAAGDFAGDDALFAAMLSGGGELAVFDAGPRAGGERARFTPFGPGHTGGLNIAAPLAAVPEPATWGLMIGGIGMAGGALRRRRSDGTATA